MSAFTTLRPPFRSPWPLRAMGLTVQGTGQPALPVMYQGVKDGHPHFFAPQPNAEIEFVPDASGAIASLILHQNGANMPAKSH